MLSAVSHVYVESCRISLYWVHQAFYSTIHSQLCDIYHSEFFKCYTHRQSVIVIPTSASYNAANDSTSCRIIFITCLSIIPFSIALEVYQGHISFPSPNRSNRFLVLTGICNWFISYTINDSSYRLLFTLYTKVDWE